MESMELLSSAFFVALASIILLDLVLAGDNAIVIALAARNLPPHLRKRAIIWGSIGAVVVRSLMTLVVVWLLKIPGLLLAGGAMLLWIGWRLLVPAGGGHGEGEEHVPAASTFMGAMKTIVIADAVMGVDNVLAVAGAAHGSYVLVVLGLLISIPIVVWGSTFLLKWTERFPIIVYLGTAVLVVTGVKMMLSEPFLKDYVTFDNVDKGLAYLIAVAAIVGGGYFKTVSSRVNEALRKQEKSEPAVPHAPAAAATQGDRSMEKVLVPVDGSPNALAAVKQVAAEFRARGGFEVVLFNVQPRLTKHVMRFASSQQRVQYMADRARAALATAEQELKRLNVPFEAVFATGERAATISDYAAKNGCSRIVLGIARKNSLTRLLENSVSARLLDRATVPVQILAGEHASRWERLGLPLGVGSAIAAIALALD